MAELSDRPIEAGARKTIVITDAQKPGHAGVTTTHIDVGVMALDVNVVKSVAGGGGAGGDVNIHDGAGNALTSTTAGANQALDVNIVAGAGAGGTSMVDDAAFTPGVTAITPMGAMFDDVAPDSVDEGDAGVPRMSANRNLYATIRDAAGNERGLNIAADNTLGINDAGGDISIDDGGNSITVDDGGIALSVDDAGGSLTVDDGGLSLTVDNPILSVVGGGTEATAQRVTIANDSTGLLSVDDGGGTLTIDGTLTGITNDVSIDDGGNSITVDGTVTAANTAGDIADDAADSGNPVKIGGVAKETDGTDPGSVSAEGDRAEFITDRNRRQLVNTGHPNGWKTNNNYGAAQTNQQQKAAPGANLSLYIQKLIISADDVVNVLVVDDTAGAPATILGPYYIAANAGANIEYKPPVRVDANTDIGITSSAAVNHTVTITGYTAP